MVHTEKLVKILEDRYQHIVYNVGMHSWTKRPQWLWSILSHEEMTYLRGHGGHLVRL